MNVIRWAWRTHGDFERRYGDAMADDANAHLTFVRLRTPDEVKMFGSHLR